MIKITFDGNDKSGYTITAELPFDILVDKPDNAGKCLFCDESDNGAVINDLLPFTRTRILGAEGIDIFAHELVVIHTDSSFDPGPHESEHEKLIAAEELAGTVFNPEKQAGVISAAQQVLGLTPHPNDTLGVGAKPE